MATEKDGAPFGIGVIFHGLSPASRKTTQTNKPPKHYSKTGGHDISYGYVSLIGGDIPNRSMLSPS